MAGYGLVDSFYIDNGELAGVTAEQAFVLGCEFAMTRQLVLDDAGEITVAVNPRNADRLIKMCWNNGRVAETEPLADGWVTLKVHPKVGGLTA